jgi:methyl-accepting chemotaxis protein
MSAIANFKKRHLAAKAKQETVSSQDPATTLAPENEALALLAFLLGCDVENAIELGRRAAEQKAIFIDASFSFDPSSGDDKSITADVTRDDDGNITSITETIAEHAAEAADSVNHAADSVNHAADSVTGAADKVEQSASAIDDSANDLAYSADSIANAANDIKEATAELKKPSAAPASLHGEKTAVQKNNSKK